MFSISAPWQKTFWFISSPINICYGRKKVDCDFQPIDLKVIYVPGLSTETKLCDDWQDKPKTLSNNLTSFTKEKRKLGLKQLVSQFSSYSVSFKLRNESVVVMRTSMQMLLARAQRRTELAENIKTTQEKKLKSCPKHTLPDSDIMIYFQCG